MFMQQHHWGERFENSLSTLKGNHSHDDSKIRLASFFSDSESQRILKTTYCTANFVALIHSKTGSEGNARVTLHGVPIFLKQRQPAYACVASLSTDEVGGCSVGKGRCIRM